ncbi:MAG: SAM-dependent methyltransferase [Thermodesulfobacteriota bacterium]
MRIGKRALVLLLATALAVLAAAPSQSAPRGKLYVIGMGPAGPQTATLQALQTVARMDYIIASALVRSLFPQQLAGKKILFDHLSGLWDYQGKFFTQLDPKLLPAFKKERARLTAERLGQIEGLLAQGKNVGLLEGGNPCVFSSAHWYVDRMQARDVVIIPGMGSAAAGMAALGKSIIPAYGSRFLLQSAPFIMSDDLLKDDEVFRSLAKYQPAMVLYMALKQPGPLVAALRKAYPADTPCAVVYWAGYPDKQRVLRCKLAELPDRLAKEKERYLGLLFVGRFLEGKPYLAAEDKP